MAKARNKKKAKGAKKKAEKQTAKKQKKQKKAVEEPEEIEEIEAIEEIEEKEDSKEEKDSEEPKEESPKEADEAPETPEAGEEEPKKKKSFFSFGSGKKKKKEEPGKTPERGSVGAFFASINNMGMGKQRSMLIQSMAMMLNAGLPLIKTLETLQLEIKNRAMKKIIVRISDSVESGTPLWKAMEEQYLFTPYEIALVRIGEEAGQLARNMEYLSIQQEKDRALRAKVKMAMIYPTIVLTLMFIIVMGLGLFVLPNLIQVLISLDAELPLTTRILIYVTNTFSQHGTIFVPLILVGFVLLVLISKFTRFRRVAQWFVFRIPGVGALARQATIARFGVIMGGLLKAGVPLVEALRSLETVTHVVAYKRFYGRLLEHIIIGDSFSKSFKEIKESEKLLPISVQQLVVTGEQTGVLAETLLKIAEIYEKKASETAEKLPVILEPMLLLFIGGLVGTIAISIITPIYSVVGKIGR